MILEQDLLASQKLAMEEGKKLIKRLEKNLRNGKYQYLDLRTFFTDSFLWTVTWTMSQLNTSKRVLSGETINDIPPSILTEDQKNGLGRVLQFYDLCSRTAFITLLMFQVELLLKGITGKLKLKVEKKTYSNIVNVLIRKLSTSDHDQKIKYLMSTAHLRNALHNNGYHLNNDFKVEVDGKTFDFIKGKEIDFAGWQNIFILINKTIDTLEEILESPSIKNVKFIGKDEQLNL